MYVKINIEIDGKNFLPVHLIMIIRIPRNANMIGARIMIITTLTV